jgi:Fic family protein
VSFDLQIPVSQSTLTTVSKLDRLRGAWASGRGIPTDRLGRIAEAATVQSVGASCRLSGVRVSDADVAGLLRGEAVPLRDARDVLAYATGMRASLPTADKLLTADDLKALHATLEVAPGEEQRSSTWRSAPLHREAFDAQGRATGRIYSTLPPWLIEQRVDDLLTWLEFELRIGERHPVLVIGTFVLGFLTTSPFENYNGRMSRLLISHLLRRAGYTYIPYASIESQIEGLRDQYQNSFATSQTRFWKGEAKLEPWIELFLEVLDRHRKRVEAKIELERAASTHTPLQQTILKTVQEHGVVDAGLLLKATGSNRNTLKDNLRRLVDRGVLEKSGQRRGTRYRLATVDVAKPAVAAETPASDGN